MGSVQLVDLSTNEYERGDASWRDRLKVKKDVNLYGCPANAVTRGETGVKGHVGCPANTVTRGDRVQGGTCDVGLATYLVSETQPQCDKKNVAVW